ncbi:hypothetical protein WA158_002928 [Blastocystis sp. Blastoise]
MKVSLQKYYSSISIPICNCDPHHQIDISIILLPQEPLFLSTLTSVSSLHIHCPLLFSSFSSSLFLFYPILKRDNRGNQHILGTYLCIKGETQLNIYTIINKQKETYYNKCCSLDEDSLPLNMNNASLISSTSPIKTKPKRQLPSPSLFRTSPPKRRQTQTSSSIFSESINSTLFYTTHESQKWLKSSETSPSVEYSSGIWGSIYRKDEEDYINNIENKKVMVDSNHKLLLVPSLLTFDFDIFLYSYIYSYYHNQGHLCIYTTQLLDFHSFPVGIQLQEEGICILLCIGTVLCRKNLKDIQNPPTLATLMVLQIDIQKLTTKIILSKRISEWNEKMKKDDWLNEITSYVSSYSSSYINQLKNSILTYLEWKLSKVSETSSI